MSTKTLHPPPRRVALANTSTTNTKLFKSYKQIVGPKSTHKESKPKICCSNNGSDSKLNNKLFAGYMAHEFLTRGTLLGQQVDLMPNLGVESIQRSVSGTWR
ncbi:hypothetical protein QL285_088792 [Trifolium repens]|nr:hypothetical protein QL285_088792 [Trifolium repens]